MSSKISSFEELMVELKRRPELFIGIQDIERLSVFFEGYNSAINVYNINDNSDLLIEMHEWINIRYNKPPGNSWSMSLLELCNNDHKKAIQMFFDEFNLFIQEKVKSNGDDK